MTEQTLLMVFIGLVALSLVGIAAVTVAIGIQVHRLLYELRLLLEKAHVAGDAVLADLEILRAVVREEGSKVRGIADFLLSLVSARKARRAKSKDDAKK